VAWIFTLRRSCQVWTTSSFAVVESKPPKMGLSDYFGRCLLWASQHFFNTR
jgi:hypothetical protein